MPGRATTFWPPALTQVAVFFAGRGQGAVADDAVFGVEDQVFVGVNVVGAEGGHTHAQVHIHSSWNSMARRSHMAGVAVWAGQLPLGSPFCLATKDTDTHEGRLPLVKDAVGGDLDEAVDVHAGDVDFVRVEVADGDDGVFDFDDGYFGGHGHDGVEVALGEAELRLPKVSAR